MAYALATRLLRAVKNAGVKYNESSGWKSHGRGAMGTVQSIVCHHTAGPATGNSPSLNVVKNGRPGLNGPLAQLFLSRDGTVTLTGAGIANHAGVVKSNSYSNSHAIGIEAEATGTTSWPDVQIDAYAKLCKALCDEFKLPTSRVLGHKEVCSPAGRKIDPNFNMAEFRQKVGGSKGGVSTSTGGGGGSSKTYQAVSYGATLGLYDKGDAVKDWQDFLIAQGYKLTDGADGYFGPDVDKATRDYQKKIGVKVDGLVGDDTWAKAKKDGLKTTRKPKKSAAGSAPGTAKAFPWAKDHYIGPKDGPNRSHSGFYGNDSTHVKAFVNQLVARGWNAKKGGTYLTKFGNDGKYGAELEALIRAFQKDQGLTVDGLGGRSTWDAAFKNPVT